MSRPLFNECPCGAAISIPLAHPQCSELAGRFDDEHGAHRQAVIRRATGRVQTAMAIDTETWRRMERGQR